MIDFHSLTEQLERVYCRRLVLRQAALADSWPLYEATRNPLFNQHLLWPRPENENDVLGRVDAIVDAARSGRMAAFSVAVKHTGEWASLFRFQPYAANPAFVEMGLWTHPKFWHGSLSLELVRICIDAAFSFSDVDTLVGAAAPGNRSSCRLMELCDLTPTKMVYRSHESGAEAQLQEFAITRAEWKERCRELAYTQVPLSSAISESLDRYAPSYRSTPLVTERAPNYVTGDEVALDSVFPVDVLESTY